MTVIPLGPRTERGRRLEVLGLNDWEAHRRDNCVSANWAAEEIHRLTSLLRFVAGHQGITLTLRSHILKEIDKPLCESNK